MAENTKIEWAHHTFNPWRGCTKVSEGCANCYAASFSKRNPKTLGVWGPDGTRIVAAHAQWTMPFKWNAEAAKAGELYRVFCASLADIFEDWTGPLLAPNGDQVWTCPMCSKVITSPLEYPACEPCEISCRPYTLTDLRRRFFKMVDATPHLDWLLVTKRPENITRMWPAYYPGGYIPEAGDMNQQGPRRNVWLLTSIENQEQADKRIPELLKCRDLAPVLGLSCEPLLGPVDLLIDGECSGWKCPNCGSRNVVDGIATEDGHEWVCPDCCYGELGEPDWKPLLDWVICGGESGAKARPMHPDWARSLRDQCHEASVPFFFKQWGEWPAFSQIPNQVLQQFSIDDFPLKVDGNHSYHRIGKKLAGRLLDGQEYNEFPVIHTPE